MSAAPYLLEFLLALLLTELIGRVELSLLTLTHLIGEE
jgi:hypothetical protein